MTINMSREISTIMASYNVPQIKETFPFYDQHVGQPLFNSNMTFVRLSKWPLDQFSLFKNSSDAWSYVGNPDYPAYPGQVLSTYNVDGINTYADGKFRLYAVTIDESKPNGLGLREFVGTEDAWRAINFISNYHNGTEVSTRILNNDISSGNLTIAPGNDNLSMSWESDGLKNILRISSSDFKVETNKESDVRIWLTGVKQVIDSSITINSFDPSIFITENPGEMVVPILDSSTINVSTANVSLNIVEEAKIEKENVKNSSISVLYAQNSSLDNVSLGSGSFVDISVQNASISNLYSHSAKIDDASIEETHISKEFVEYSSILDASIDKLEVQETKAINVSIDALESVKSTLADVSATNADIINSSVVNSYVESARIVDASLSNAEIIDASIENALVSSLDASSASLENASATFLDVENASIKSEYVESQNVIDSSIEILKASTASISKEDVIDSSVSKATIGEAIITSEQVESASIGNASISSLIASIGSITSLSVTDASIKNIDSSLANVDKINVSDVSAQYITASDISIGNYSLKPLAEQGPSFYISISDDSYNPVQEELSISIDNPIDSLNQEYYFKTLAYDSSTMSWSDMIGLEIPYEEGKNLYQTIGLKDYINGFNIYQTENLECVRTINLDDSSAWYGDIVQSLWPIFAFSDNNNIHYNSLKVGIALYNSKGRCSNIITIEYVPKCIGLLEDNTYGYEIKVTSF